MSREKNVKAKRKTGGEISKKRGTGKWVRVRERERMREIQREKLRGRGKQRADEMIKRQGNKEENETQKQRNAAQN